MKKMARYGALRHVVHQFGIDADKVIQSFKDEYGLK